MVLAIKDLAMKGPAKKDPSMKSPTDLWCSYLAKRSGNSVPLKFMKDVIAPDLRKLGYQVVPCKVLAGTLAAGLEPLLEVGSGRTGRHGQTTLCSFEHFLNLLWLPLIEFLETSANGGSLAWTKTLALHQKALLLEMQGVVMNAEEPLDMDLWIQFVQGTLQRLLGVKVPSGLIMTIMGPLVPLHAPATRANALHLLRSSLCSKLVGPALASQVNRMILAEITEVPVEMVSKDTLDQQIKMDLIAALERAHCEPEVDLQDDNGRRPPKKRRRSTLDRQEHTSDLTTQDFFFLKNVTNMCLNFFFI